MKTRSMSHAEFLEQTDTRHWKQHQVAYRPKITNSQIRKMRISMLKMKQYDQAQICYNAMKLKTAGEHAKGESLLHNAGIHFHTAAPSYFGSMLKSKTFPKGAREMRNLGGGVSARGNAAAWRWVYQGSKA